MSLIGGANRGIVLTSNVPNFLCLSSRMFLVQLWPNAVTDFHKIQNEERFKLYVCVKNGFYVDYFSKWRQFISKWRKTVGPGISLTLRYARLIREVVKNV